MSASVSIHSVVRHNKCKNPHHRGFPTFSPEMFHTSNARPGKRQKIREKAGRKAKRVNNGKPSKFPPAFRASQARKRMTLFGGTDATADGYSGNALQYYGA
ncbi:hypothetical protein SERLADRAFT_435646 [Serpula lacrymans var. lacrymans S7.9]|uniref:Uncharacterized protein n=1 Tax=Serpula lacrymans var. lacrymans (strain S7.9) TaxID=578457 RepID=F8NME4_SERL9|nr:uncharacterized protein SERLADRAFT_435646 [Serpula lacrymans var. lacrymans S7.9]EGO27878.1 hypothetical protein SERLADRAFT_435646 [Serpula lacrymans var. lacrymans S7.9]